MKLLNVNELLSGEQMLADTGRSRVKSLVLEPAVEHVFSATEARDRWLLVLSGEGQLVQQDAVTALRPASLTLIAAGENGTVGATSGDEPLVAVCFDA